MFETVFSPDFRVYLGFGFAFAFAFPFSFLLFPCSFPTKFRKKGGG